jgi:hypothetical protein
MLSELLRFDHLVFTFSLRLGTLRDGAGAGSRRHKYLKGGRAIRQRYC